MMLSHLPAAARAYVPLRGRLRTAPLVAANASTVRLVTLLSMRSPLWESPASFIPHRGRKAAAANAEREGHAAKGVP